MTTLENIFFQYPDSDFKLEIDRLKFNTGSKTDIIGTSGYGKTTMLNLIACIILPERGDVLIEKNKINAFSDKGRRDFRIQNIGFIFQDFKLISYLNVMDNILLPFRINSTLQIKKETAQAVSELAKELGIANKLKKYPSKLSHGEKQRVAICRALLNQPSIILADEPTGNLDPENKKKIMDILFSAVEKYNATLITVTHDHDMLKGFEEIIDFKDFQKV
jgi:putative ABC transport system ATP-binding protein